MEAHNLIVLAVAHVQGSLLLVDLGEVVVSID